MIRPPPPAAPSRRRGINSKKKKRKEKHWIYMTNTSYSATKAPVASTQHPPSSNTVRSLLSAQETSNPLSCLSVKSLTGEGNYPSLASET